MARTQSFWDQFGLDVQHVLPESKTPSKRADSARASLYSWARSHNFFTKAYIREAPGDDILVFKLSLKPIESLEGQPPRGSKSHRNVV